MSEPIFIIKLGDTFKEIAAARGDFEHWVRAGLDEAGAGLPVEVVDPRGDGGASLSRIEAPAGVVVTGSHAMVTDREPWSEATARWLARLVAGAVPVLGICYGHQLLAPALGGGVGWHPRGDETGNALIRLRAEADGDALFAGFPRVFSAAVSHSQTVLRLPPGAVLLAENDFEPHHAFRVGPCAWGVQFHPEFNADVSRHYIDCAADELRTEGRDVAALRAGVGETPLAASVLPRFARIAAARAPSRFLP
ncbi:MAG: glutamine amidotransferase [Opitutaceae bacterium]|jgi:GMP synthase (glutamine-hydrolysing)|nr:glutamine amidotransferase [Opitutaceae bacterium]